MKKILSLVLVFAAVMTLFCSCGDNTPKESKPIDTPEYTYVILEDNTAKEFAEIVFYGKYEPIEVKFAFDSAVILSGEFEKIAKFGEMELLYDKVIVEGCACVIGDETYNKVLSTKRAKTLAKALDTEEYYGSGECTKYPDKSMNRHAKIILK